MILTLRRIVAGLLGLVGVAAFFSLVRGEPRIIVLPALTTLVGAVVIHVPRLGMQLVARATWWSNFALAVFLLAIGARHESAEATALMTGSYGLALLVAGRAGIAEASERTGLVPVASRRTFTVLLTLVLADLQTMGLFVVLLWPGEYGEEASFGLMLFGVVGLTLAFVGLYRLQPWGALASIGTSAIVAIGKFFASKHSDMSVVIFIGLFCTLQIVVATPMLFRWLRRPQWNAAS